MALNMQLRPLILRAVRCFSSYKICLVEQRLLVRCISPLESNLKPANNFVFPAFHQQYRCKWKRKGQNQTQDEDSDSDSDSENDIKSTKEITPDLEPGTKVISYKMDSTRIDRLVRKALNLSGKELEELFYDRKIHLNDNVLKKKSEMAGEGDVITVALQKSSGNTALGALIEILEVREETNGYKVTIARNKNTHVSV